MPKQERQHELLEQDQVQEPPMYKVLLHNDDYTPMEFVVQVLVQIFGKPEPEAVKIMLSVHHKGFGLCGIFAYEVAETKVAQVEHAATEHGYPLKCTLEPE